MHVIGTAGHVDHGKSTLIKALTGIDPDRLREEKERQMTIDLGFAWLEMPSGQEVGIIDVPGHRDFIENMLAGAGGIDAVLFVIAADEGIMPQSREHLAILKLLEIKSGIIVLTKIDLIDDYEWLDLVKTDIWHLMENTFLAEAPIISVSALTGKGLPDLLNSISDMIKNCEPKANLGKGRLPVDRVFSIKGFGTVITGTMLDGSFSVGQKVEILPQGIEARIRGIQSHKKKIERAEPGSRTAINLTGLDIADIRRGDVITEPGKFSPTKRIDARFSILRDASNTLEHNDECKIFCGAAQSSARVRLIGEDQLHPDDSGWLQLEFQAPMVVAKGDHFILRRPSPSETIGGGIVLDAHPEKRHKRFSRVVINHFEMMETGSLLDRITALFLKKETMGMKEMAELLGIEQEQLKNELQANIENEFVVINYPDNSLNHQAILAKKNIWEKNIQLFLDFLEQYHKRFPLRQGISKIELREHLNWDSTTLNQYCEGLTLRQLIKQQSGLISLVSHRVELTGAANEQIEKVIGLFKDNPYTPPSISDLKQKFGQDLIMAMIADQVIIATSEDIAFRKEDFLKMGQKLAEFIDDNGGITLSQFRDLFQTSRKYASSFLEFLDKRGATNFDGEKRTIRNIDKISL